MRNRSVAVTKGMAIVAASVWLGATTIAGQAPAYRAPRGKDGKPNLNGIWQAVNEANWDLEGHGAAPGPFWQLGAEFSVPPGLGVVEGRSDPLQARSAPEEESELCQPDEPGSRDQVLPAGRAARDVHALPVSDRPEHRIHHDGLRVCGGRAHRLHEKAAGACRQLDGMVQRALGRRDAGHRYHRLQRPQLVRPGGQLTTATHCTSSNELPRRGRII